MSELNQRITSIDGFSSLGHADKIRFFAWYLHEAEGKDAFEQKHITECFDVLGMQRPPGGIGTYLVRMADRKPPELLRRNGRYELERRARDVLAAQYGQNQVLAKIDQLVAQLPSRLSNAGERVFLEEMLVCLRNGASRSCVVMAWNLAYSHLCEFVLANKLVDFNLQLPKSCPKAGIAAIAKYDDFACLKEFEVLKVCKSAHITSNSVDKILNEKLARPRTPRGLMSRR
jgi:hypothetical protein